MIVRHKTLLQRLQRFWPQTVVGKVAVLSVIVVGSIGLSLGLFLSNAKDSTLPQAQQSAPQASTAAPALPDLQPSNKLEEKALKDLRAFGEWLRTNNVKGYIGEAGWPGGENANDQTEWNALADKWYQEATNHNLWITAWAAGSWWGDYAMRIYDHQAGETEGLNHARSQATVLERYTSKGDQMRGVNLAGMEFSTEEGFTNTKLGTPGQQYFYEPDESFAYLKSRGVKLVRLPVRWERLQPQLGGPLNARELTEIRRMLTAANQHDMQVVFDLHNYGTYKATNGDLLLGKDLRHDQLVDVWKKISHALKDHPGLSAYGLMNEPHDLPAGTYGSPAKNWEAASQAVVDALRQQGDSTLLAVAGYDWSSLARWSQNHPSSWIKDPANNFRYEAHHYWDNDGSGFYINTFQKELEAL